jgi:hypothetical protein
MRSFMIVKRLSPLFSALVLVAGCAAKSPPATGPAAGSAAGPKSPPAAGPAEASTARPAAPSPLEAARAAVKDAQAARAEEHAPEPYRAALEYLRQAESGSGAGAREAAIRAEASARVATAQAEMRQVRDENRRLEERLALTQQALEGTETELIRSKARLKGTETKAEASSAIAEARILQRRLRTRSAAATLCQESLSKAEQQLAQDNYGAAVFFALKAQDIANRALAGPPR